MTKATPGKTPAKAKADRDGILPIAKNRRAFHDFEVLEQIEAGLVLQGTEVKSLRQGQVSFQDAYVRFKDHEAWLVQLHIAAYSHGTWTNHEPDRPRKLLLHRREIEKMQVKVTRQGLTVVPLEMHFRRGYAKVVLGVCRGRKVHDKRQALRQKEDKRQMERQSRRR